MTATLERMKRRLRYWFNSRMRHQLLREEMEFHVDALAEDLKHQGMTEQQARTAAHRRFGNMTRSAEESKAAWISRWMSDAAQDLRYTVRTLLREAGFTTFAILIVGLGIGACATIFSVVDALLVRPLPFDEPARLAWVANQAKDGNLSGQTVQVGHLLDLREHNQSFSDLAAYFAFYGVGDSKITGAGEPERVSEVPVSENFFPLLGVKPQLGRLFTSEECKFNGPSAVLLGHMLWKRRFDSDPNIVGRKLTLNDRAATIVGVLPESFDFSSVFAPGTRIDLYSPFPLSPETNRWGNTLAIIGRLKPGATVQGAQAELSILGPQIEAQHPERNGLKPVVTSLEQHVSGSLRPALLVLASAVCVVMLIVCANLSNLQLARTAARQKEMAIRAALGAGRRRLIRQMLTESIVLSCCGAVLGVVLAALGTRLVAHLDAMKIPLLQNVRIDATALGFTLAIAILTGLIFGLAPALQVPAIAVHDALKDTSRGSSDGRRNAWLRNALVVAEVAFACVLLIGAGLLIRSFLHVLDVNLGFQPERAAALRIDPSRQYSTQALRNAYFDDALRRVKALPGIESAGLTDVLPLGRNRTWGAGAKGQTYPKDQYPLAFVRIISDGYFRSMGIPLRAGRDFTPQDAAGSKRVIILNETLARTLWPGQNPIGQMVAGQPDAEVIGVVGDVRHVALEQNSGSEMYYAMRQTNDYMSVEVVVRTALPPGQLASAVRSALLPIEPNLPASEFEPLQQLVDKAVSPRRFIVLLLGGFAAFALILASLGIYGVVSYGVAQRTREIGIRMALGASSRGLQSTIILETLGLAGAGILVGGAASWALARTISGLLYGVSSSDPATFTGILLILGGVAALAGYLPARRAARIDPMQALRAS